MDGQFKKNPYVNEHEDADYSPENSEDSPRAAAIFNDSKMVSTSSPKRSRRAVQKRVISVPIKDVEGSRLKGETPPPSDSWAWRKYGQKPIKGSPYPRGYYRCSSSKGCPARKQVERSRVDPTMLVVTYSCEHNHPWPASKNNNNNMQKLVDNSTTLTTTTTTTEVEVTSVSASVSNSDEEVPVFENHFSHLGEESLIGTYEFKWFSDFGSTSSAMLESPILGGGDGGDRAVIFPMGEEDESLFADLGELPECSVVFRRGVLGREEEERRRCNLAPWCGTTS